MLWIVRVALGQRWVIPEQGRRYRTGAEGVVPGGDDLGNALLGDRVLHRHAQGGIVERRDRLVEREELNVQERTGNELQILVAFDIGGILEVDLVGDVDRARLQLGKADGVGGDRAPDGPGERGSPSPGVLVGHEYEPDVLGPAIEF